MSFSAVALTPKAPPSRFASPPGGNMRTVEDLEHYLIRLGMPYEEIGAGTWVIHDEFDQIDTIVVRWAPPMVVFRVKLMDVDGGKNNPELFRKLLELNASDMVAGAFGI